MQDISSGLAYTWGFPSLTTLFWSFSSKMQNISSLLAWGFPSLTTLFWSFSSKMQNISSLLAYTWGFPSLTILFWSFSSKMQEHITDKRIRARLHVGIPFITHHYYVTIQYSHLSLTSSSTCRYTSPSNMARRSGAKWPTTSSLSAVELGLN